MISGEYYKSETPPFGRRQTKDTIFGVVLGCKFNEIKI